MVADLRLDEAYVFALANPHGGPDQPGAWHVQGSHDLVAYANAPLLDQTSGPTERRHAR